MLSDLYEAGDSEIIKEGKCDICCTFLFTHSSAIRPTARPPQKPEEMYPAEGPPPLSSMIYVTIHPTCRTSVSISRAVKQRARQSQFLTSNRHLRPNIDKEERSKNMNRLDTHKLVHVARVLVGALLSGVATDVHQAVYQRSLHELRRWMTPMALTVLTHELENERIDHDHRQRQPQRGEEMEGPSIQLGKLSSD